MKISDIHAGFNRLASLPAVFWALLVVSFAGGFLLRGGCGGGGAAADDAHIHVEEAAESAIWTCSMHPQIQLPEPGKCPICFMDLIPLSFDDTSGPSAELQLSKAAEALAEIVTVPVRKGRAVKRVRLSGKVVYDETRYRKITAWTGGRIEHLYADETGMAVQAGEPLFELFSPELYSAQEEYLQALNRRSTGSRETTEMLVGAAAERLVQLGMSRKQLSEIEKRGTPAYRVTIFSPISGVVIHKNALEGVYVKQGDPVYTLADLSVVWIRLDAYERDIPWLRPGAAVEFTAAALPGDVRSAKVTFISPLVDDKTRTASVRAKAANSDGSLKPGMFVTAEITAEIHNAGEPFLLVPASAVLRTGDRAVVYIRTERDGKAVFTGREVVLGVRADTVYTVVSGLSAGEDVVVHGNFIIDSAMQIEAKPSMMNPVLKQPAPAEDAARPNPRSRMPGVNRAFLSRLEPVFEQYLRMQKAFVGGRFPEAGAAARSLNEIVSGMGIDPLSEEETAVWSPIRDSLLVHTGHARHWDGIADARDAFQHISNAVISLEEHFGHPGSFQLHQAFCPMAFDNRGAFWLQDSAAVSNPYYGSMMLRCGEIRKTYPGTGR